MQSAETGQRRKSPSSTILITAESVCITFLVVGSVGGENTITINRPGAPPVPPTRGKQQTVAPSCSILLQAPDFSLDLQIVKFLQ